MYLTLNKLYVIVLFTFSGTDLSACCGVFICRGSYYFNHSSNFGRVVTYYANIIMARNTYTERIQAYAYNGVFVCHGSQTVSHISNFARVVICNASVIMHAKKRIKRKGYDSLQGCFTLTKPRHHSKHPTHARGLLLEADMLKQTTQPFEKTFVKNNVC